MVVIDVKFEVDLQSLVAQLIDSGKTFEKERGEDGKKNGLIYCVRNLKNNSGAIIFEVIRLTFIGRAIHVSSSMAQLN